MNLSIGNVYRPRGEMRDVPYKLLYVAFLDEVAEEVAYFEWVSSQLECSFFVKCSLADLPDIGGPVVGDARSAMKSFLFKREDYMEKRVFEFFQENCDLLKGVQYNIKQGTAIIESIGYGDAGAPSLVQGVLEYGAGHLYAAVELWKSAVIQNPGCYLTYMYLGDAYYRMGMPGLAEKNYRVAQNKCSDTERGMELSIKRGNAYLTLAQKRLNRYKERFSRDPETHYDTRFNARDLIKEAINCYESIPRSARDASLYNNLILAYLYWAQVHYLISKHLPKISSLEVDKSEQLNEANKGCEKALSCFVEGLELGDKCVPLFCSAGSVYYQSAYNLQQVGRNIEAAELMDNAIKCYQKAVELEPSYYEAHYNLGKIYCELQVPDYSSAIECLSKSIEIKDNRGESVSKSYFAQLAKAYLGSGQMDMANFVWRQVTKLQHEDELKELVEEADEYFEDGTFEPALSKYKEAMELEPRDIHTLYKLARCYDAMDQTGKAIKILDQAVRSGTSLLRVLAEFM